MPLVLEQPGVIVLRDKGQGGKGDVTVYVDPVDLAATEELSKIELGPPTTASPARRACFHVVVQLNGTLADLESWVKTFDFDAMLGVIDAR